jgi:hypothetical protein
MITKTGNQGADTRRDQACFTIDLTEFATRFRAFNRTPKVREGIVDGDFGEPNSSSARRGSDAVLTEAARGGKVV